MSEDKSILLSHIQLIALECEGVEKTLANLPKFGRLKQDETGLAYLDIDDAYISKTYDLIKDRANIPAYFGEEPSFIGAHISVFYPNENVILAPHDINVDHHFEIVGLFEAEISDMKIYALKVKASSLTDLRYHYNLPEKLSYKGCLVDFHITVGTKILR